MLYLNMADVNPFVDRVLDVVAFLTEEGRSHPLGEISARLGLSKPATHRMLAALVARGWVDQEAGTGFYRLTLRLPILAHRYLRATRFLDVTQPVIDRLARASREHARLTAVVGSGLTWLVMAQGATSSLIFQGGSGKLPLHASANGKAWLATLTNEEAIKLVLETGFGSPSEFGPNAARSVNVLLERIEETRRAGFGINIEESEIGVITVAAVIRLAPKSPVVGTVSVSGPSARFTVEIAKRVAQDFVIPAAAELGEIWPLHSSSDPVAQASAS
jgi:IclR family acetate operon transcriptional repressor